MERMLKETNLTVSSKEATIGHWTRVKKKDTSERSVIDYILASQEVAKMIKYIEIDEHGTMRLKGKEETDHNTITVEIDLQFKNYVKSETIYNTKNKENWKTFNKELISMYTAKEAESYTEFEEMVKKAMDKTLKKITIKRGQYKPKITELAKQLKKEKKTSKKGLWKLPW